MDNLLTIKETAQQLSMSPQFLRKLVKAGEIKAIVISKRGDLRFSMKDIEEFIEKSKTK